MLLLNGHQLGIGVRRYHVLACEEVLKDIGESLEEEMTRIDGTTFCQSTD